ncbi:hypothetical protein G9A89_020478 [Geosiphon pyriformis]|nr:hypothetical protein G9A89_020478 [Geosiphon pyriformis]
MKGKRASKQTILLYFFAAMACIKAAPLERMPGVAHSQWIGENQLPVASLYDQRLNKYAYSKESPIDQFGKNSLGNEKENWSQQASNTYGNMKSETILTASKPTVWNGNYASMPRHDEQQLGKFAYSKVSGEPIGHQTSLAFNEPAWTQEQRFARQPIEDGKPSFTERSYIPQSGLDTYGQPIRKGDNQREWNQEPRFASYDQQTHKGEHLAFNEPAWTQEQGFARQPVIKDGKLGFTERSYIPEPRIASEQILKGDKVAFNGQEWNQEPRFASHGQEMLRGENLAFNGKEWTQEPRFASYDQQTHEGEHLAFNEPAWTQEQGFARQPVIKDGKLGFTERSYIPEPRIASEQILKGDKVAFNGQEWNQQPRLASHGQEMLRGENLAFNGKEWTQEPRFASYDQQTHKGEHLAFNEPAWTQEQGFARQPVIKDGKLGFTERSYIPEPRIASEQILKGDKVAFNGQEWNQEHLNGAQPLAQDEKLAFNSEKSTLNGDMGSSEYFNDHKMKRA